MNSQLVTRVVVCAALVALSVPGAGLFPTQPVAGQETAPVTLHGAAALNRLKHDGQYESLQAAMNQARLSVSRTAQTPLGRAAWHAPNSAAGYDSYVTEEGVSIAVKDGAYVSLSLHSLGYGADLRAVAPGEVSGDKQTIKLAREGGLLEWYVNGPDGLEHGFTLAEPPPGARQQGVPLRLALRVSAGWRAVARGDGKLVTLRGPEDQAVEYGKLVVRDKLGRNIPARLTVADAQVIIEAEDSDATYPLTIDPLFFMQQKLTATDGTENDYLGYAVALSGDTALVGAPYDDETGMEQGSAYVFVRNGATWTQQARLTAQDRSSFDYFGWAVALDGDTALVGAVYGPGSVHPEQGAVYVFVRGGTTWSQQARLNAGDGQAGAQFGAALALDGQTALIGAPTHQISSSLGKTGAAYVFVRNGAAWTQQARLSANDGEAEDQFGAAVALDHDTALIGAPADNVGTNGNQGSAYLFTRNGVLWDTPQKLNGSNGEANDSFGNAVALSGETALIGAYQRYADDIGIVYAFERRATGWTETNTIGSIQRGAGAHFGVSVALSGDTAVIGASRGLFAPGPDQRSAYVFVRNGNWVEVRQFGPELGSANDGFGYAVALDGDTVLVGAYRGDANATDQGAAYAFVLHDGQHVEQQQLTAGDGRENDHFGAAVALSGDTLAVGAPNNAIGASPNQGSVYVFTRSGTAWTLQQKLTADDGAAGEEFGFALALSGDTLVVGAYRDAIGGNANQGSAYVFTRNGLTWTQQQKLTATDGEAGDHFGFAVALSGDTAVIGALEDRVGNNAYQGSAYVFTRNGVLWGAGQKLTASDGAALDYFGYAVAARGDTVAVGAFGDTIGANARQGSVYVFTGNGLTWTQQQKLTASDGAANDHFGNAVALNGDTLAAGAARDTIGENVEQGSVYIFTRNGATWTQQPKLTANDGIAGDRFGHAVALSGDALVVGALYDTIGESTQQGSVYIFTRNSATWMQQPKLTASDGMVGDRFGSQVALSGDTVAVGAPNDTIGTKLYQGSAYVFVSPPCPVLAIAPDSLPNGAHGAAYTQQLTASGSGVGDYRFSVSSGALPPGLTLDPSGLLHGTPTATGTYSFTITTTFLLSGCTGRRDYTITVTPPCPTITVNPDSLPEGQAGRAYSQQFSAGGGAAPYSYAVVTGALPGGMSLSAAGFLSGAPTVFGTFNFTVRATDANGCTGTRAYILTIAAECGYTLTPTSQSFAAAGVTGAVMVTTGAHCTWTATSDAPWLTIIGGANGTGDGQVTYRVATNTGPARQAVVTVAGQTHHVQQAAAASETPSLVRLAPNSARMGTGGLILNVIGTSFTTGQRVQWNGSDCETSFLSERQLLADIPAVALSSEGTATVLVVDTANGAQSNPGKFRVIGAVAHTSAASYNTITLAPDSIVAAFGDNLATEVRVAESLPLPTELAGTTVTVRDSQGLVSSAPLFFVAPTQVNYLMPPGLANGVATVTITNGSGVAVESLTEISAVAPGLFSANASGGGAAAAVALRIRANGEQVYEPVARYDEQTRTFELLPIDLSNADEQVYLILFGAGIRHRGALEDVTIELGETELPVVYAGAAPGAAGLDQVNVLLPASLRGRGQQTVVLRVNDEATNGVNVRFQ